MNQATHQVSLINHSSHETPENHGVYLQRKVFENASIDSMHQYTMLTRQYILLNVNRNRKVTKKIIIH